MPDITDAQAFEIFHLWEHEGLSRREIAERVGYPATRIFDRSLEARKRGKLIHPMLAHLPRHQGRGGGRPRGGESVEYRAEIEARIAEVRARKLHGNDGHP